LVALHLALFERAQDKGDSDGTGSCEHCFVRTLAKTFLQSPIHETIADLRLATHYLRALAALRIADEAEAETDPESKATQLEREFVQLYSQFLRLH